MQAWSPTEYLIAAIGLLVALALSHYCLGHSTIVCDVLVALPVQQLHLKIQCCTPPNLGRGTSITICVVCTEYS